MRRLLERARPNTGSTSQETQNSRRAAMNALKSLVSGLITAASTALILFGSGAHGQEVKDPATLPPLESIDAQTDITVFLQNGVPNELRLCVALGGALAG